jgi:hypothetical protein
VPLYPSQTMKRSPRMTATARKGCLVSEDFEDPPGLVWKINLNHSLLEMESTDSNVENVRKRLLERSVVGLEKYHQPTTRTDINLRGWLIHLQEELMDATVYIEAALTRLDQEEKP